MDAMETVPYVDAQRDIAAEMGERDIRREIMRHRGRYNYSFYSEYKL